MKRVLLVDDDPLILKLFRDGLMRHDFQVETASDGLEAMKALRSTRPDIVVLDLMMPKLSGVDVLKFIRGQKDLAPLPVIVLSNSYVNELAEG
ncbi:MAG: response regulator, partial [Limisphaerales bacterium]